MACNLMTNISYLPTVHPYITPQPHSTYSLSLHLLRGYIFIHSLSCHYISQIHIHYVTFCDIPIDAITFVRFATWTREFTVQMRVMHHEDSSDAVNDTFLCHWPRSMTLLLTWFMDICHWVNCQWHLSISSPRGMSISKMSLTSQWHFVRCAPIHCVKKSHWMKHRPSITDIKVKFQ